MNASANTNNIAANILNILEGKSATPYQADVWNIFDFIFSSITIISVVGIFAFILITLRMVRQIRRVQREKVKVTRKRLLPYIPSSILTLFTILAAVIIPIVFGSS